MTARGRLDGEDAAWLHMERATNPMVVNGVMQLEERMSDELARTLVERLAAFPRFRSRVIERAWELVPSFDVQEHYGRVTLDAGDQALRRFVGQEASTALDPSLPLWRVTFVDRPGTGTAVFFRVHHCIADGFGLLGVLSSLCEDESLAHATRRPRERPPSTLEEDVAAGARAVRHLLASPADAKTILKRPLGTEKRVAWSELVPLVAVKGAATLAQATVNDVLVAVVTGALRRYLARAGENVTSLELHAMVPVNLRPPTELATLGNRFGLVILGLPIGIEDPLARVSAVHQRMERLKDMPEAALAHDLLRVVGRAPRSVEDLVIGYFTDKTSLVVTNVPGPTSPLSLGGIRVSRIIFWVPQSGSMGLGVSIFSYAGEVTVGVIADTALVPDPELLVADVGAEIAALDALVRAENAARALPRSVRSFA